MMQGDKNQLIFIKSITAIVSTDTVKLSITVYQFLVHTSNFLLVTSICFVKCFNLLWMQNIQSIDIRSGLAYVKTKILTRASCILEVY